MDIVQGHTDVLHQSQIEIPLGERPRTNLMLLARRPGLVEMTWGTVSKHDYWRGLWVWRRECLKKCIYTCNSGKRCLTINSDGQPDTTEIDPAVAQLSCGTRWIGNCVPDCTRIKLSLRSNNLTNDNRRFGYSAVIFSSYDLSSRSLAVWWRWRVILQVTILIQQEWHGNGWPRYGLRWTCTYCTTPATYETPKTSTKVGVGRQNTNWYAYPHDVRSSSRNVSVKYSASSI